MHSPIEQRHVIQQVSLPHNVGSSASVLCTIEHRNLVQQVAFPYNVVQHDQYGPMSMMQPPMERQNVVQHNQYGTVESIRSPIEQGHVVQQTAPSHYVADAHNLYLNENPSSSLQDPYGRYRAQLEIVQKDIIVQNASQYAIPSSRYVPKNYAQRFPDMGSPVNLQSQASPPSYMPPLPAGHQGELPAHHEPYYPEPVHENPGQAHANLLQRPLPGSSESNVPVSSRYVFSGAAPTYL